MKNESSKNQVKDSLEILSKIRRAEIAEDVFEKISDKIRDSQNNRIQPILIRVAAAAFIGLLLMEQYIILKPQAQIASNPIELLLPVSTNSLYHE